MATFVERMIGAARLDVHTYEEVEADPTALGQAMGVVVLSSVAAGIGMAGQYKGLGIIGGTIAGLAGWFIWAWLTYFIGTRILPTPQTHADWGQLARTIGFAASPGVFRVLGVIPFLGGLIGFAVGLWMLAAFVVAVRQALDYTSTWRALGVCVIGWIINVVIMGVMMMLMPGMRGM